MDSSTYHVDKWLEQLFMQLAERPAVVTAARRKFAIMSTPRCGSTFFCESLRATGCFGDPSEWLNPRRLRAFAKVHQVKRLNLSTYLDHVLARTTTPNGVFSLNLHVDQYQFWKKQNFDILSLGFDTIIHVYRRDKVSQAYSYAKALETDQWRSYLEPQVTRKPQDIRVHRVTSALAAITAWEEYFQVNLARQVQASYAYEDFVENPQIFQETLDICGVDTNGPLGVQADLRRQRRQDDEARVRELKAYLLGLSIDCL